MQDKYEDDKILPWLKKSYNDSSKILIIDHKKILDPATAESVRYFLEFYRTITKLEFNNICISNTAIRILSPALEQLPLELISFYNSKITDEMISSLHDVLKNCIALTRLDFRINFIGDQGAGILASALENNKKLIELNLAKNKITAQGVKALSLAFKNNPSIHLKLTNNPIGSESVEILCHDIKEKGINTLRLEKNNIGDTGISALSEFLQQHFTLSKLILSGNYISPEGANSLKLVLANNQYIRHMHLSSNKLDSNAASILADGFKLNRGIKILNLSFNRQMGAAGVEKFTSALTNHPALHKLDFKANQIGDEGANNISCLLQYNTILTSLNFDSNAIGVRGGQVIAEALKVNHHLKVLVLSDNPIGDDGAILLAEAIKGHQSIKTLSLKNTIIKATGALALAAALKENQTLTHFELSLMDNDPLLAAEGAKALIDTLKKNSRLIKFEFECKAISEPLKNEVQVLVRENQRQPIRQKSARQFTYVILILARNNAQRDPSSYWAILPYELKCRFINSLCLDASRNEKLGKSYEQLQRYVNYIFTHIAEINQKVFDKTPIKILEKIPQMGNSTFTFFKPSLKRSFEETSSIGSRNDNGMGDISHREHISKV